MEVHTHFDAIVQVLDLFRQVIDRVDLLPAHPHPAADSLLRSVRRQMIGILEVRREHAFEFLDRLVVLLDQGRERSDSSSNVDRGGGIRNVERGKQGSQALVVLCPFRDRRDLDERMVRAKVRKCETWRERDKLTRSDRA